MIWFEEEQIIWGRKYVYQNQHKPCPVCIDTCPVCWDQGVVRYDLPQDHQQFGKLFPCPNCTLGAQMAQNMHRSYLRESELPEEYKACTFEQWDALPLPARRGKELARFAAEEFANTGGYVDLVDVYKAAGQKYDGDSNVRRSLVFTGNVGVGKTGLAASIINHIVANSVQRPLYIRALDALESIQARMGKDDGKAPEDILDGMKRAPILVLDEFNLKQYTPWRLDHMESLVRYRYNNNLPTIFTMNIGIDEVEEHWGLQTASALKAMAHKFVLTGEPLRDEGEVLYG